MGRRWNCGSSSQPDPQVRLHHIVLLLAGCLLLPACSAWDGMWDLVIDRSLIEQQQAEIAQLKAETDQIKAETEALRQQARQAEKEREDCNTAFYTFEEARKAADEDAAVATYREGLRLCPTDDVAHNELGELYLRLGRRDEAILAFEEAVRLNANFVRAQRNLQDAQQLIQEDEL